MGSWLVERHRNEMYTIGLHMYEGHAADNGHSRYRVGTHKARSIERILHQADHPFSFVDMLHQEETAGNSWMFRAIEVLSWGRYPSILVPRDQYDGILFIEEVNPPTYIN